MLFNFHLNIFPQGKEFYQENELPIQSSMKRVGGEGQERFPILEGEYKGRKYQVLHVETQDSYLWRFAKGLTALFITCLFMGVPLLNRSFRNLFTGRTIREFKVLVPEESTGAKKTDQAGQKGIKSANNLPSPVAQEKLPELEDKLFDELKTVFSQSVIDYSKAMELLAEIKKIDSKLQSNQLYRDRINEIRAPFWRNYARVKNEKERNTTQNKLVMDELNIILYKSLIRNFPDKSLLRDHFKGPKEQFKALDGIIDPNHPECSGSAEITLIPENGETFWNHLPGYKPGDTNYAFQTEQIGALSQIEGRNYLCGYYGLFFLLQSIKESSLCDRSCFDPLCLDWLNKKIRQRLMAKVAESEKVDIGYYVTEDETTLSPDNISEIAETLPELKDKKNWFVLNYFYHGELEREIGMTLRSNIYPLHRSEQTSDLPIYLVYQADMHFYFVKAEKTPEDRLKLTIAHSLNYHVSVDWQDKNWRGLLHYLSLLIK